MNQFAASEHFAIEDIAQWITSNNSSADYAETAIESFIDTIACIAAGSDADLTKRLHAGFGSGGSGDAPVFFSNFSQNPSTAALLNATAGHALELDDWDKATEAHMSVAILPALLALSKKANASGSKLVDAFIVGLEAGMCCGKALNPCHLSRGWHPTSTIGALGAAAACSRLLGLTTNETANALSLATTNAGLKCQIGTTGKALHAGFASQTGLQCAVMASQSITASPSAFDGAGGIQQLLSSPSSPGFQVTIPRLGQGYYLESYGLVRKLYPTCGIMHRPIDGTLEILSQNDLSADDVASVTVTGDAEEFAICGIANPTSAAQARFSIAFGVAAALCRGGVTLADLDDQTFVDPDYRRALAKVRVLTFGDAGQSAHQGSYRPVHVDLMTQAGESIENEVAYARGWPEAPLLRNEVEQKFVTYVSPKLGRPRTDALLKMLCNIETLPSVDPIIKTIS